MNLNGALAIAKGVAEFVTIFPVERLIKRPKYADIIKDGCVTQQPVSVSPVATAAPMDISQEIPEVPPKKVYVVSPYMVSPEEVVLHQRRELGKRLLLVEGHLNQRCRIAGKPCDCVAPKHATDIEALAEESVSIDIANADLYTELAAFGQELNYKARPDIVLTNEFYDEYPELALRAREYRKQLLGTTELVALLEGGE